MSRTIKFRAWDGSRMWFDVQKSYDYIHGTKSNNGDGIPATTFAEIAEGLDNWVPMQFTGLLDKNGKEIYEGDVVRVYDTNRGCMMCEEWEACEGEADEFHKDHGEHGHEKPGECEMYICTQKVRWEQYGYFCDEDTGDYRPGLGADEIEMEVIGNIYENPELIATKV